MYNLKLKVREFEDDKLRNQHMKDIYDEHDQPIGLRKKSVRQLLIGTIFAIIMSVIDYWIGAFQPIGWVKTLVMVLFFLSGIGAFQIFFGVYGLINTFFNKTK